MNNRLILGCIADDFTGGSDAASFLATGGMNTILLNGIPDADFELPEDAEAAVIALKSRTQEPKAAVADSLASIHWLKDAGASHFYIKYCSTFDSTHEGNIGPILDAVLEDLGAAGTILCPALPANGRIVKKGLLYVKGVPLAESPMKDHPLTPMWESSIAKLMEPQGKYESLELHDTELALDNAAVMKKITEFAAGKEHWYIIPDYVTDADAARIVELFGHMTVLSGGSGVLTELAKKLKTNDLDSVAYEGTEGKAIIVAGSCSVATHAQTTFYENNGGYSLRLTDKGILDDSECPDELWKIIHGEAEPLVYSYSSPEELAKKRNEEGRKLSAKVEQVLSGIARKAMDNGTTRIISAGGETSGAVTKALGFKAYHIGISIAPGVPVMTPVARPDIRLVLKSGNFGQEDFFQRALELTKK